MLARLGQPRRSKLAPWECRYQIIGGGADAQVRRALGEDALQSLLLACAAMRAHLQRLEASWLSLGSAGIPPFVPDSFGPAFTEHLEALIYREVVKFSRKLERAQNDRSKMRTNKPANQRLQPTAARRIMRPPRLNRGR